MGVDGQDWASYQPARPDTTGLSFAFVKVTEGLGYVNPLWQAQRDHAKANGLLWGGYHYPHMANPPEAEADRFLAQVDWQPGDLIVLDWEGYDTANTRIPRADQLAYKDAWLRHVKQAMPHNPVGAYMNADYWTNVDTSGYYADFLWIATVGRAAGDPGIGAPWLFHQYTDTPVDSDYCHLASVDELRSWALAFAPPTTPTPPEDPMNQAQYDEFKAMLWGISNDVRAVPDATWNHKLHALKPDGSQRGDDLEAFWFATWRDVVDARYEKEFADLKAMLTAQSAAVAALAGQLGGAHPGVDTAVVVAAVQQAVKDAVVHVDVQVSGTGTVPVGKAA